MAILIVIAIDFSGRLPRMVCQLCIAVGDHFSRCWYYHLYDRKPQKLAELYDVADFYDFMQHCSGNTDFYRYRDGTAFCTDRICVFLFLFLGTLIIGDRRARVELKRRFHVR